MGEQKSAIRLQDTKVGTIPLNEVRNVMYFPIRLLYNAWLRAVRAIVPGGPGNYARWAPLSPL